MLLLIIYLAFISLGLPDSLLGAAWPSIYPGFGVPVSCMGIIFMIISVCTVISSLQSDRLTKALGTGRIVVISILLTCGGLFGFSVSRSMLMMCLFAVPYGLGAGSIDAALNNFVALHYKSRHMSWLHCMWGVGASIGPYVMGFCISRGFGWGAGYRSIGFLQAALAVLMIASLPLWKNAGGEPEETEAGKESSHKAIPLKSIIAIPGAREIMVTFFCYCALEQTAGQWAASYLNLVRDVPADTAASFASLFYIGITLGRLADGFLTFRLSDVFMIRMGLGILAAGILLLFLPLGQTAALLGFIVIGLGCAPVYPCLIHSTPAHFGKDRSQAVIGVQMASAYIGTTLMPPLFGWIMYHTSFLLLPFCLLAILILMFSMHESMIAKRKTTNGEH
ncbi:MAG: MFS transporter [Lachnospiraceae bacterium]|jgi:fucose permease